MKDRNVDNIDSEVVDEQQDAAQPKQIDMEQRMRNKLKLDTMILLLPRFLIIAMLAIVCGCTTTKVIDHRESFQDFEYPTIEIPEPPVVE